MMNSKKTCYLWPIIIILYVLSCSTGNPQLPIRSFQNDIFYEIWVKSFADSEDPDAIGDLKGIIEKLDYLNDNNDHTLNDLGVTGIKLSPIFDCGYKSRDPAANMHGYDVTDYDRINEIFGTRDDVKHLLDAAHARGIKVLFDFVPNHTSSKHPWFLASKDNRGKRDWYIWESRPDTAWRRPWGGGSWHDVWFNYKDSYYYSAFQFNTLPDLNYKNDEVRREMENIIRQWLDFGFDGFRIDAARYIFEDGPGLAADRPGTHKFLKSLRRITDAYSPPRIMVAEIMATEKEIPSYFGNGRDEVHLCYNFPLAWHVREAIQRQDATGLKTLIAYQQQNYPCGYVMANLFSNHDNLNSRPYSAFYGSLKKCLLAAALTIFSEGTPFIYYGNEIALEGGRGQGQFSDAALRKQFNWDAARLQINDPNSIWQWYRKLIAIRQDQPPLQEGTCSLPETGETDLLACLRRYKSEQILILYNFSGNSKQVSLSLPDFRNPLPVCIPEGSQIKKVGHFSLNSLPPYGFAVFYSGGRSDIETEIYSDSITGGASAPELPRFSYHTMYLRGSMNQWRGDLPMQKKGDDIWAISLSLKAGHYQYKFEVDGKPEWGINWGDSNGDGIGEIEGPPIELVIEKTDKYLFRFNEKEYTYMIERIEVGSQKSDIRNKNSEVQ